MYRATSSIINLRTLLTCCRPLDYHLASITNYPPKNGSVSTGNQRTREPCPIPPPPPPKPPRDDTWFWAAVAALFISGVGIVAAKNSPEVRDWMTLYAPWVDDLIAIVYEENMTYGEFANQCIEDIKKYILEFNDEKLPKECSTDGKPAEVAEVPEPEEENEEDEEYCPAALPPVVTQDICDIEKCLKELGEFVIHNLDTAKEACLYYNALVDETMNNFTMKGIKNLHSAQKERECLVKESINNANNAIGRLDEMCKYLDCGVQATKTEIENTKTLHRDFKDKHKAACMEFQWENDKSIVKDRQWRMTEELMDKYTGEMESLYPTLKYMSKKPALQGDPDALLYSTYRYVVQKSDELSAAEAGISERVNRAYDSLLKEGDAKSLDAKLNAMLAKRRANIAKEFKDRQEDQKQRNQKLLADLTKQQLAKHEALMAQKIEQQEKEVMACFTKMVDDKVEAEKRVFANELANMRVKLDAVEQRLNARLKAERETRRSQTLWAAGSSLLAATKKGGDYINVNKELNAIEKASDGEDKLVLTVLKSIPPLVREKGITPESVLKEKYSLMEDTALKVALVEEDGGPMPVYILSWLQAMLLFMKISGIPQKEYDKPPLEPAKDLDTFDLLQRARFWMERGNLATALRYVNGLKGASRLAAHHWYETARAHLEVRQAAEAILAHAAAMGLQYI